MALIVALWHTPVPWIHSHRTMQQPFSEALLDWHIHHFHPVGYQADEGLDWHVHLIFPCDEPDEPAQSESPGSPKPTSAYAMPYVLSQVPTVIDSAPAVSLPVACDLLHRGRIDGPHFETTCVLGLHFLETYPPRVPMRALIGVALC